MKGEFRLGDRVISTRHFGVTIAGTPLVILEKAGDKKWLVSSFYDDDKCELSEDELHVMAPYEKRIQEAGDKTTFDLDEQKRFFARTLDFYY